MTFREFASDGPISGPLHGNLAMHADLGGFGWNMSEGMFLPTDGPEFDFEPPYPEVGGEASESR